MALIALGVSGGIGAYKAVEVARGLQKRGHDVVAPDLPCDDDAATLRDYADTVVDAIGDLGDAGFRQNGTSWVSRPVPVARPEMMRQNSTASTVICSPSERSLEPTLAPAPCVSTTR